MTRTVDAIVIGGGHNGLACAAYLAKNGMSVELLEAAPATGGAAATTEFAPGFSVAGCANFIYQLQADVVSELKLTEHGLDFLASDLATIALSKAGEHLAIRSDGLSEAATGKDQQRYTEFRDRMIRFAGLLGKYLNTAPPLLKNGTRQDAMTLARLGFDIRRLGKTEMREFLRIIAINIYDVLNEYFDSEQLKGALATDAVLGTHLGPRSPNTVLTFLHRLSGSIEGNFARIGVTRGGMGAVSAAFTNAAKAAGVTIRTSTPVEKILVRQGRVCGVELADGEQLFARVVASNADPKTTLMNLLGVRHLETGFTRRLHHFRMRGNAARLYLALNDKPEFSRLSDADCAQRLLIAPDMDYVERAFNPAKYGQCSIAPVLELSIPTLLDNTLAPEGKHVLAATVQYAPFDLKGGWTDNARSAFEHLLIDTIAAYAPGIRDQIEHSVFLSPTDIERDYRIHGGHWHHGELALDQFLFARPVPGASQYAMPIEGLYLCGAGAHPGGGISGASGRNAATAIIGANA